MNKIKDLFIEKEELENKNIKLNNELKELSHKLLVLEESNNKRIIESINENRYNTEYKNTNEALINDCIKNISTKNIYEEASNKHNINIKELIQETPMQLYEENKEFNKKENESSIIKEVKHNIIIVMCNNEGKNDRIYD